MSDNFKNFNSKFNVDELLIVQTEYWRWSLRPIQCTFGAGILSLRRPAETMSELSAESTLRSAYGMDKMNYIMLMMVDIHIHYHVVPRYAREIEFAGQIFKDQGWPKPPVLDAEAVDKDTLLTIRDFLKSHVQNN